MEVKTSISLNEAMPKNDLGRPPFACTKFLKLCEKAAVVGEGTGWRPLYFLAVEEEEVKALLPAYLKTDSFGEFIFDWAWADLYQRSGLAYYPKLVSAIPFSPVNVEKVIGDQSYAGELLRAFSDFLKARPGLSSAHALFLNESEANHLAANGFFKRQTLQFHLRWTYSSFDEFLQSLKARKRKQIRKERNAILESDVTIETKDSDFSDELMERIYELYLTTIDKKWSQAYLNKRFFIDLPKSMPNDLVLTLAKSGEKIIAMALFLKSEDTLYGRYWGVDPEHNLPYLHFELSFYQGMEYCARHGLKLFEAGAQGEQKLLRGFTPVEILSAHKLNIPQAHEAIKKHVEEENRLHLNEIENLKRHLPYKELPHGQTD